jgi:outer membrane protein OmpA-like peptidoglycan-associated protein
MLQQLRMDPWLAGRILAYTLLAFILLAPLASLSWTHVGSTWFPGCVARQQEQLLQAQAAREPSGNPQSGIAATGKNTDKARAEKAKFNCMLLESELAAGVAIGTFGLVMILWWLGSELHELRQICEPRWSGLDDCDVESVGPLTSVAYAALFLIVILASAGILFLSVAGARDSATIPIVPTKITDERNPSSKPPDPSKIMGVRPGEIATPAPNSAGSSDLALIGAVEAQTRAQQRTIEEASLAIERFLDKTSNTLISEFTNIQAQIDGSSKRLDALDSVRRSVERTEQALGNVNAAAQDLAKSAKRLDEASGAIATSLKSIDANLLEHQSIVKDGLAALGKTLDRASATAETDLNNIGAVLSPRLDALVQSIARRGNSRRSKNRRSRPKPKASLQPTGSCFIPKLRNDPDPNVQKVRVESATERQRAGLPEAAAFRQLAEHLVFFDNAASRLSSSAEAHLMEFLASAISGKAALSIRGYTDGRGSRAKNERLSRERAVEVAMIINRAKHYPPVVELDWSFIDTPAQLPDRSQSDPYLRIAAIKALQLCP